MPTVSRLIALSLAFLSVSACGVRDPAAPEEQENGLRPLDPPNDPPPEPSTRKPPSDDHGFKNCWIAFIHGSGDDFHTNPQASQRTWSPNGMDFLGLPYVASNWGTNCHYRFIGYAGTEAFNADTTGIARQLKAFIDEARIPDKRLIIVTHSMGGLALRYLLNLVEPSSPKRAVYWESHAAFDAIKAKTSYAITLQAPHFGSEAADAVHGEATRFWANVLGVTIRAFGIQDATRARYSMRRKFLDTATWMADEGRTVPIYTLAGTATKGSSSRAGDGYYLTVTENNDNLETASGTLFGDREAQFPNDGLVEERSAHGTSIMKSDWKYINHDRTLKGAFHPWVSTPLNHNHGRYSDLSTTFTDARSRRQVVMTLGEKIRRHGLGLPCSDPEMARHFSCP